MVRTRRTLILVLLGPTLILVPGQSASAACSEWRREPSPAVPGDARLNVVFALSATDVWAGGYQEASAGAWEPLIEHFDGTSWSISPTPTIQGAVYFYLDGIAGAEPADVWATGNYQLFDGQRFNWHPVLLHWDGSSWTSQAIPGPPALARATLLDVSAFATDDVWISLATGGRSPRGMLLHWKGTRWAKVRTADDGALTLRMLSGTKKDVWGLADQGSTYGALTERWDGASWSSANLAGLPGWTNAVPGFDAATSTPWAVGWSYDGTTSKTLVERWDGAQWTIVPSADVVGDVNGLYAVAALRVDDAWSVGHHYSSSTEAPLIERWDGAQWVIVPSRPLPGVGYLLDVTMLPGDVGWAVGAQGAAGAADQDPLILASCAAP